MDQNLDRRLQSADPARATPAALDGVLDELATLLPPRRRRWWLPLFVTGGALALTGGLATATDVDTYLLSVPPFATLGEGTVRSASGLPYVPRGETDRGEQCALYLDLGGITDEELTAVSNHWSTADPEAFASGVEGRLVHPPTDEAERQAIQDQILEDLGEIVPGIAWGTAPPGEPFRPGEPHLGAISQVCSDDLAALEANR